MAEPSLPPLDLLLAPAACGKTSWVAEQLERRRGRAIALVPSGAHYDRLRARLGRPRGLYLAQFLGLARRPLRLSGKSPILLDGATRPAVIRHLLHEQAASGRLPFFARVAQRPGFVAAVGDLLNDLGSADIAPERFARAASSDADTELAALYRTYEAFQQARGLADLPLMLRMARDVIHERPELVSGYSLLIADGFDQFAPLQLALLAAYAQHGPQTIVTLTHDDRDRPAHRRFRRTLANLEARFTLRETRLTPTPGRCATALAHLEEHLFELDAPPLDSGSSDALALIEAADPEREVRAVLRAIKDRLRSGTPASEIAVLYRYGQPYTGLLREIGAELRVPLDIHEGEPINQAPPVAALLGLLRLPLDDFPRRALMETLRNPYLQLAGPGGERPPAATLDAMARRAGVAGSLARWRAALGQLEATEPDADDETFIAQAQEAEQLRASFEAFVGWATPPRRASVAAYVGWVRERLEPVRALVRASEDHPTGAQFYGRDTNALQQFEKLLAQLQNTAGLLETPALDAEGFLAELEAGCAGAQYERPRQGGVAAMPVFAARGSSFEHVCLLGLSEGSFPAPLPEPPIYDRYARRELRAQGLPLALPDPADERTIFYEAVTRARQTLTLSRTRLDAAGAPLARSPYLKAVLALAEDVPTVSVQAGSAPAWEQARSGLELMVALADALAQPADEADVALLQHRSTQLGQRNARWPLVVQARHIEAWREGLGPYTRYEGALDSPELIDAIAAQFGPPHQWSTTQLNDYVTCPFRFLGAHVLRIAPRTDPEDELDTARRGQLYHAILAQAGQQWRREGLALEPAHADRLQQHLAAAAEEVLETAPTRFGFAPSAFWEWERGEVTRRLRTALEGFTQVGAGWQEFHPARTEHSFGGGNRRPPLAVATAHGEVLVQGRIDRIDRREDGALAIVDYKSGSTPRPIAESVGGFDLQLPVYMLAVESALGESEAWVERAAFFHIGSGKRGGELAGDNRATAREAAVQRIEEVVGAVRQGQFDVRPLRACPSYCAFEAICRRNLAKRDAQAEDGSSNE